MRPLRGAPARCLLGPLLVGSALLSACAPTAGPAGPSTAPSAASASPAAGVSVLVDAALPRLPLARFLPGATGWPDRLADGQAVGDATADPAPEVDHGIVLGGIGSDLFPADAPDEYWMVTDRGPNGQVKLKGPNRRTFPVPQFDPLILRVRAQAGAPLTILQVIPVTTTDGSPVSGLPNDAARDETPYDWTANTELPINPSGLDTEGLVRTPNGEFWLAEEYSPSLLHVSATGTVLGRLVPQGLTLPGAGYPVTDSLPAVFADRQGNRGFESLALVPDGTHALRGGAEPAGRSRRQDREDVARGAGPRRQHRDRTADRRVRLPVGGRGRLRSGGAGRPVADEGQRDGLVWGPAGGRRAHRRGHQALPRAAVGRDEHPGRGAGRPGAHPEPGAGHAGRRHPCWPSHRCST